MQNFLQNYQVEANISSPTPSTGIFLIFSGPSNSTEVRRGERGGGNIDQRNHSSPELLNLADLSWKIFHKTDRSTYFQEKFDLIIELLKEKKNTFSYFLSTSSCLVWWQLREQLLAPSFFSGLSTEEVKQLTTCLCVLPVLTAAGVLLHVAHHRFSGWGSSSSWCSSSDTNFLYCLISSASSATYTLHSHPRYMKLLATKRTFLSVVVKRKFVSRSSPASALCFLCVNILYWWGLDWEDWVSFPAMLLLNVNIDHIMTWGLTSPHLLLSGDLTRNSSTNKQLGSCIIIVKLIWLWPPTPPNTLRFMPWKV